MAAIPAIPALIPPAPPPPFVPIGSDEGFWSEQPRISVKTSRGRRADM
jgi:hypothetical protein